MRLSRCLLLLRSSLLLDDVVLRARLLSGLILVCVDVCFVVKKNLHTPLSPFSVLLGLGFSSPRFPSLLPFVYFPSCLFVVGTQSPPPPRLPAFATLVYPRQCFPA